MLRPLGGTTTTKKRVSMSSLEKVEPAHFDLPNPNQLGDHLSCRLLRDAVRLGFRSSAGPFRSFAKINVEWPRPYQLVPLMMALKLDPIRILISDDVGIGKTVEACLIARELLERGEVNRMCVLCPPHLAEQWQSELRDKFHVEAELVLPSTANRLEKRCHGQSLFEFYPFTVVSMDFIKSERNQHEFLRTCPELVVVDEAHTCAFGGEGRAGRHLRFELLKKVAAVPDRHVILVSAVPHSGNEDAFRSLLTLLSPDFANLPDVLTGKENEHHRRRLAAHFIQRRRADIEHYLDSDTPFPKRIPAGNHAPLVAGNTRDFSIRCLGSFPSASTIRRFPRSVSACVGGPGEALALLPVPGQRQPRRCRCHASRSRASVNDPAENEQAADEIQVVRPCWTFRSKIPPRPLT